MVWGNVPAGAYTITARSPSTRFASFVATCKPGRVVNANPPWGLHELGLRNPVKIAAAWSVRGAQASLGSLTARNLPAKAVVRVRCTGPACPFATKTVTPGSRTANLRAALGSKGAALRAGQTLEVTVTAHTYDGTVVQWPIRSGSTPRPTTSCVPLGNTKPRPRC